MMNELRYSTVQILSSRLKVAFSVTMLNGWLEESDFILYLAFCFCSRLSFPLSLSLSIATEVAYFHLMLNIMGFGTIHHETVGPLEAFNILLEEELLF